MDYRQSWKDRSLRSQARSNKSTSYSPRKSRKTWKEFIFSRGFFKFIAILIIVGFLGAVGLFVWASRDLPNPNQLMDREVAQSTKIYDRTGETVLYDIHGDKQRTLIQLKDIPNYVKNATIAVEDKNFYNHKGFSVLAILRTAVTDILFHKSAGASTLTQQFVKNAILSSEKTFTRKIKEIILAYRIEQKFSKDEILQMYLNEIPYGSTAYGVEAASQKYFNKDAKDLTLAEAAVLAALPQSPSYYFNHQDALLSRQKYILGLMVEQGYITQEEADKAKAEKITFAPQSSNITAPHFVMYVKELLTEKYGEKMVEEGGLKIITTIDLYKQQAAEEAINDWWNKNKVSDDSIYNKYGASNAALVSIDPKTGQILAMVGSRDYFNNDIDGQVNIATSPRQPGSSLKPLVYSTLFTKGYTPNTILYDVDTNFSSDPSNPYEPKDYDLKERGPVSIRQALAGSLNIPAVKATYLAGLDNVISLAQKFGYTTLNDKDRFGLSFALGGAEVSLLEHTDAYGVFAREGVYHPSSAILKVEDKNGKVLEEWKNEEQNVLDQNIVRETNSILADNSARAFIFGEKNYLTLGDRPVGAKTGTTNDYKDAWTMGFTPSIVTGVWVGNNDNKEMKKGSDGSIVAAPIWNEYMKKILGDTPIETFNAPEIPTTGKAVLDGGVGGQIVKLDKITKLLATDLTPPDLVEEKIFNQPHDILFYVDKNDPLGPVPTDPNQDPQFILWDKPVQDWYKKQSGGTLDFSSESIPTQYDNVHTLDNKPIISISSPLNNQIISNEKLSTNIQVSAPRGVTQVNYYLDNNLFTQKLNGSFNLDNYSLDFLNGGYHNLKIQACDDVENCADTSVEINVVSDRQISDQNFNANLSWPESGTALTNIDFPVALKFDLTSPENIGRIEIFAKNNDIENLIGVINPKQNNQEIFSWSKPASSGSYTLYGKIYSWGGQTKQTNEVIINASTTN